MNRFINGMAISHDSPETNLEVGIILTLLLVGLSMFATIIGNISSLLTDFDSDWVELQNKVFVFFLFFYFVCFVFFSSSGSSIFRVPPTSTIFFFFFFSLLFHQFFFFQDGRFI